MCFKLIIMCALPRTVNNGFFISRTRIVALKRCHIDNSCPIKSPIKQANFFLSSIMVYFKIAQVSRQRIALHGTDRSYNTVCAGDAAARCYEIFRDSPAVCKVRAGSRDFKAMPVAESPREAWRLLSSPYYKLQRLSVQIVDGNKVGGNSDIAIRGAD